MFITMLLAQVVAKTASKFKVPRFIYISTDEVYGHLTSENDASWSETAPIAPRNTYSATKAAGEHLVAALGHSEGLNYNIIRMANNYGPRQTVNKFIPRAVQSLINNEKIKIYGQGRQIRDWLHVRDSYTGIQTVIEKGVPGEIYNIGAGQEFSNIEVAQLICKNMQRGLEVEFVAERPGHDFRYSLSSEKIRKLGWEPKIKFKDGIENTIEWFMLNRYWINKESK
jgi:dTDP-glucose 4,6-dehydratase